MLTPPSPRPLHTQGLRALRAIKPLRMLTRSAGMRMVFKSIVLSLAAMANVSIVLIIFFFIFAILGTQLFMGLLARCGKVWGEVWMYSVGSQGHPGHAALYEPACERGVGGKC